MYAASGRLTKDLNKKISGIQYNYLHLPKQVDFTDGRKIEYVYDASGVKLQTKHTKPGESPTTTDYFANRISEDGVLKMIRTEEGYAVPNGSNGFNRYYYIKDHLGNNRVVMNENGGVEQVTNYYPFGTTFAENPARTDQDVQRFKFGGKELDRMFGLDMYDFEARMYSPVLGRFMQPDPMAEKYYSVSPYAYCANNPVNRIDPTGMDWYTDKDGTRQYNPNLTEKNQSDILKEGQAYVGATYQVKDGDNIIEDYRADGSIMYSSEASGYKRMWNNTQKTGNEEMGVITKNGVLVLPSWDNDSHTSKVEEYGYSWNNGKLVDAVDGKSKSTLGTAHTHPTLEKTQNGVVNHSWMGPSGEDYQYFGNNTPGTPFFVITADMRIHSRLPVSAGVANKLELPVVNGVSPTFNGIMFGKYPLINVLKSNKR